MISGILGKKLGMLQVFQESKCLPVTIISVPPCLIMQVKTEKTDGYNALQLGTENKVIRKDNTIKGTTKAEIGHAKKHANTTPKKFVREVEWDGKDEVAPGKEITLSIFEKAKFVDIIGTSKGRGFSGVMKRHGFSGGKVTHGQSDRTRAPGSIGASAGPARVMKGKRMAGQFGNHRSTVRNLKIISIDLVDNTIAVNGPVPGPNNGYVIITRSVRG